MNSGKVVYLRPESEGSAADCSVFLRRRRGKMVEYELSGASHDRKDLLAVAAMLEAVGANLRLRAAAVSDG